MPKITIEIELDIDKASWFDAVGGIDIPARISNEKIAYGGHLQIPCGQGISKSIINEIKQEAKDD